MSTITHPDDPYYANVVDRGPSGLFDRGSTWMLLAGITFAIGLIVVWSTVNASINGDVGLRTFIRTLNGQLVTGAIFAGLGTLGQTALHGARTSIAGWVTEGLCKLVALFGWSFLLLNIVMRGLITPTDESLPTMDDFNAVFAALIAGCTLAFVAGLFALYIEFLKRRQSA